MTISPLAYFRRLRCSVRGHDWAGHLYQPASLSDVEICTRCGATRLGADDEEVVRDVLTPPRHRRVREAP